MPSIPRTQGNSGDDSRRLDSERTLLGCMLISDANVEAVLSALDETDLSLEAHRLIFRAVRTLHAAGDVVDYVTIKDHIRDLRQLRLVGGPSGISDLLGFAVECAPIAYHVRVIKGEG